MKLKHAAWAVALAAAATAPAFAQTAVTSGNGATVTTSTNVIVTPAVPASVIAARARTIPDAVVAEAGSRTIANGDSKTTITSYWVNVPPDLTRDASFQRWQRLK